VDFVTHSSELNLAQSLEVPCGVSQSSRESAIPAEGLLDIDEEVFDTASLEFMEEFMQHNAMF
jgi:hypothetical protein